MFPQRAWAIILNDRTADKGTVKMMENADVVVFFLFFFIIFFHVRPPTVAGKTSVTMRDLNICPPLILPFLVVNRVAFKRVFCFVSSGRG